MNYAPHVYRLMQSYRLAVSRRVMTHQDVTQSALTQVVTQSVTYMCLFDDDGGVIFSSKYSLTRPAPCLMLL